LIDVPGVGHDGKRMSAAAAPIVYAVMHGSLSLKGRADLFGDVEDLKGQRAAWQQ